jgi:TIR domain-containing protein
MTEPAKPGASLQVFISYSHKDKELRGELDNHLSTLKRNNVITTWHDVMIEPGTNWKDSIAGHLDKSQVVLPLISSDFIASDYCYCEEMSRAYARADAGDAQVIPVLLRPVDYEGAPFAKYQALPEGGKPVTLWSNRDEAFTNIAVGIRKAVNRLIGANKKKAEKLIAGLYVVTMPTLKYKCPSSIEILNNFVDSQNSELDQWGVLQKFKGDIAKLEFEASKPERRSVVSEKFDKLMQDYAAMTPPVSFPR